MEKIYVYIVTSVLVNKTVKKKICVWANIFWRNCFDLRFKIDVVVMIIWSIVIIINFVLTLLVSPTSLSHDREPCEIKVVFNHTCSLHTVGAQSIARAQSIAPRHSTYVIMPKNLNFENFCLERLRRRSLQADSLKKTVYFCV